MGYDPPQGDLETRRAIGAIDDEGISERVVGVIEQRAASPSRPSRARSERWWVAGGTLTIFSMELIALGVPSFWYDETATYSAASRSWPDLWALLGNIDAVHGLFYSLMHPLVQVFGPDAFAMRVPSALAVALTSAGIYGLTRYFGPPLSGITAALVFAGLARTSSLAVEARSFMLATLVATALTLILIAGLRARGRVNAMWLLAYAALAVAGIYLYVYLVLVVAAHAITVLLTKPRRHRLVWIVAALIVVGMLCLPLIVAVSSQRGQLGGTFPVSVDTWTYVFFSQFFDQQWLQALAVWALLGASVIVLLLGRLRPPRAASSRSYDDGRPDATHARVQHPSLLALVLPWLLLPTFVIVAISAVSPTIYQPRALIISAPALCILLAEVVRRAFGARTALIGAIVVLALGVGPFVAARQLTSQGEDWPVIADYLGTQAASGDGIVYSEPVDYHSWPSLIRIVHPEAVAELDDVTLVEPYTDRADLFDRREPLALADGRLEGLDRVWYVRSVLASDTATRADAAILRAAGFTRANTWDGPRTSVDEWVRADD